MPAATYAIKFGLAVDDLADMCTPRLTMSESLRIATGRPLHHAHQLLRRPRAAWDMPSERTAAEATTQGARHFRNADAARARAKAQRDGPLVRLPAASMTH